MTRPGASCSCAACSPCWTACSPSRWVNCCRRWSSPSGCGRRWSMSRAAFPYARAGARRRVGVATRDSCRGRCGVRGAARDQPCAAAFACDRRAVRMSAVVVEHPPASTLHCRTLYIAAALTAAIGLSGLSGWIFAVPGLRSVLPGAVEMKANTALGLLLAGIALAILGTGVAPRLQRSAQLAQEGANILINGFGPAEEIENPPAVDRERVSGSGPSIRRPTCRSPTRSSP